MITFSKYQSVLRDLRAAGIQSSPINALQFNPSGPGPLYIKHDVEARIDRALRMAKLEAAEGHYATYYVQGDLLTHDGAKKQLKEIAALGHEVTYHYDVLDANNGDFDKAQEQFEAYLRMFKSIGCKVTTVCPHGNPTKTRNNWKSNKDFFRSDYVRSIYPNILDIVLDFPKIFPNGRYISDTGRELRVINEIATNDKSETSSIDDGRVVDWSELVELVQKSNGLVLSAHPHRFHESLLIQKVQLFGFTVLKKTYLRLRHIPIVQKFADRFYKLARRF